MQDCTSVVALEMFKQLKMGSLKCGLFLLREDATMDRGESSGMPPQEVWIIQNQAWFFELCKIRQISATFVRKNQPL